MGKVRNWELLMGFQDLPCRLLPKLLYETDLIPVPDAIPEHRVMLLNASFPENL